MVAIGSMAQDPFVFFVEGVHRPPGKRDSFPQLACVGRQVDVLPRGSRCVLPTCRDGVPRRKPEIGMPGGVLAALQDFWTDVGFREVRHRIPAWLEEQQDVLAVSDPSAAEAHAHAPSQRLDVQKPLR
jgi:hypothetical protein